MKASNFLKIFGWCGGTISFNPPVYFSCGDEIAELYLSSSGNVKWRWKKPQQDKVDLQTKPNSPPVQCGECYK
jgi:hypothetical protein